MPSVFTLKGPDLTLLGSQLGAQRASGLPAVLGGLESPALTGDSTGTGSPWVLALALGAGTLLGAVVGFGLCRRGRRELGTSKRFLLTKEERGIKESKAERKAREEAERWGFVRPKKRSQLGRIEGLFEERITPKRKAQELILHQVNMLEEGWWIEDEKDHHGMTGREADLVLTQVRRQRDRIGKLFGYDPWSA